MYQVPLVFAKIGSSMAICATRLICVLDNNSNSVREMLREEKKAGTAINGSGRKTTKSVLVMDNGTVIAAPITMARVVSAIEKSNAKTTEPKLFHESPNITILKKKIMTVDEDDLVMSDEDEDEYDYYEQEDSDFESDRPECEASESEAE